MAPEPPAKRLRMKTPDPKHRSPDARALKKAQEEVAAEKKNTEPARKISFSPTAKVQQIQAENPPGKATPGKAKPAKPSKKMSEAEADAILANFRKDCMVHIKHIPGKCKKYMCVYICM